jgi:hypothetical protein
MVNSEIEAIDENLPDESCGKSGDEYREASCSPGNIRAPRYTHALRRPHQAYSQDDRVEIRSGTARSPID